ncbi:MAG: DNA-directed RNA polymerase subunit beta, partial [Bacteroidales bacterium]|nr:DNA-directed RNA polymerase subunit beta [Bacteroidales bacterium]
TYLSAEEEEELTIAQATELIDKTDGSFINQKVKARQGADYPIVTPEEINAVDIAPNQIASIAASLIPFLEHDDANRALMGSNMMRQAVPLLRTEAPIIGTGIEEEVCKSSRSQIYAEADGEIEYVDANQIRIKYERTQKEELVSFDSNVKIYYLTKFQRTNQSTTINIQPIVKKGEKVVKGQVLTEGYGTQKGELALGRNLMVAFMPWKGYNFEDAIVISEKVVKEDIFTSIHIEEFTLEVRDTKRGIEELTNDIPNVSTDVTKDLDENGIVRVGAHVKEGDILIGKITPKGESYPTPEEKLLRAIFGDKAGDVKDASLKAPPSMEGIVLDNRLFSRMVKTRKGKIKEKDTIKDIETQYEKEYNALKDNLISKLYKILEGKLSHGVFDNAKNVFIPKGPKFSQKALHNIDYNTVVLTGWTTNSKLNNLVAQVVHNYNEKVRILNAQYTRKKFAITIGDELPAGIIQMAKVYVANKRKLKIGDKMAGRHGNKGIIARIVREEDMPFMEDGTPVDIVLNPLGVPSRMNIGQIYETILGWAGKKLGVQFATPIFDGANTNQVNEYLLKAGLPENGDIYLYDGGTGERFEQTVTVGYIYMMKLHHLVDDKMHARSIGPYSLITQQPLGGKAQFGGQRFGEMEVWALEAFGAANILQEILTVKSDDVVGRAKAYEAIVKGDNMPVPNLPESFNVLVNELKSLCLNVTFE